MASYNNALIFGRSVSIRREINPKSEQLNAFFGVTGLQSIFGGLRGRVFYVEGVLAGGSPAELNAAELIFESYKDGFGRVLVDTLGNAWSYVLLDGFQPQGRILLDFRAYYRPYRAVFHSNL